MGSCGYLTDTEKDGQVAMTIQLEAVYRQEIRHTIQLCANAEKRQVWSRNLSRNICALSE